MKDWLLSESSYVLTGSWNQNLCKIISTGIDTTGVPSLRSNSNYEFHSRQYRGRGLSSGYMAPWNFWLLHLPNVPSGQGSSLSRLYSRGTMLYMLCGGENPNLGGKGTIYLLRHGYERHTSVSSWGYGRLLLSLCIWDENQSDDRL